jgi:hypothetical protein
MSLRRNFLNPQVLVEKKTSVVKDTAVVEKKRIKKAKQKEGDLSPITSEGSEHAENASEEKPI